MRIDPKTLAIHHDDGSVTIGAITLALRIHADGSWTVQECDDNGPVMRWRGDPLEPYGVYGKGMSIAEAVGDLLRHHPEALPEIPPNQPHRLRAVRAEASDE